MTQYEFAIAGLLAAQAFTLTLLWETHKLYRWYSNVWVRDTKELLELKRERNNG
jgi:hypothetical protein